MHTVDGFKQHILLSEFIALNTTGLLVFPILSAYKVTVYPWGIFKELNESFGNLVGIAKLFG